MKVTKTNEGNALVLGESFSGRTAQPGARIEANQDKSPRIVGPYSVQGKVHLTYADTRDLFLENGVRAPVIHAEFKPVVDQYLGRGGILHPEQAPVQVELKLDNAGVYRASVSVPLQGNSGTPETFYEFVSGGTLDLKETLAAGRLQKPRVAQDHAAITQVELASNGIP